MASYSGTTCHERAAPPFACVLRMETHNLFQPAAFNSMKALTSIINSPSRGEEFVSST